MTGKNNNQIIRIDGKNVFLEVMNEAFEIGKVRINFIEYDPEAEKNQRIKQNISIYIDMDKFLVLANDVLNGRMAALAKKAKEDARKAGQKYCKEIWNLMGGVSAKALEERGKARSDGKSLSRQMKITPGEKIPWIFSAETGPGEETETGLIAPKYNGRPEELVRVPVSDHDLKCLVLITKTHIEGFIYSQYVNTSQNGN